MSENNQITCQNDSFLEMFIYCNLKDTSIPARSGNRLICNNNEWPPDQPIPGVLWSPGRTSAVSIPSAGPRACRGSLCADSCAPCWSWSGCRSRRQALYPQGALHLKESKTLQILQTVLNTSNCKCTGVTLKLKVYMHILSFKVFFLDKYV